jgi:hypothetical protein
VRSSMKVAASFPKPVAAGGMVGEPGQADTKLSWARGTGALETVMCGRRLYLNDTDGQGPGPCRRGGAVMEPAPPRQDLTKAKPE